MKTRIETAKTIVQPRSRRNLPSLTVSLDGSIDLKKRGFDSKQTRTLFSVTFLLRCVSHLATASLPTMRGVNTLRGTSKVVPRKGLELGMLGWSLECWAGAWDAGLELATGSMCDNQESSIPSVKRISAGSV